MLLKDWSAEFVETEELKDPLPVDIEHPQVIRFVQIVFDRLKMPAIPLLCERKRNLKGATNLPAHLALNSSSSFGSRSEMNHGCRGPEATAAGAAMGRVRAGARAQMPERQGGPEHTVSHVRSGP